MTSSAGRQKRRYETRNKLTQRLNERKLKDIKKVRKNVKRDSRGKVIDTKPKQISNIGKNADFGQRAAKLKQSMGGIGSMKDYKKTEQKAFKKAEKYQKKKKKEEDKKNKLKIKKNKTTGGGSSRTSTPTGYVRYKGKLVSTRTPQGKHAMNKLKAKKRAQEMAKKRLGK
tara:strand:+ start:41 stop:550 length:510 start_codon:yes stop_codon:yes gene_type:complete